MKDFELKDGKAVLSLRLVQLLNAKPKDRIIIEYANKEDKLIPVIKKSNSGNLLSASNTFVCRGKDKDFLEQFGDEFEIEECDGIVYLKGNKEFTVFTSVKQAVKENYLDIKICTDTNYDIEKFSEYKL